MNPEKIRQDFPLLERGIIYFDNACMSLKPRQVVEAMNDYYLNYPACAGRSVHKLSAKATEEYAKSRGAVAKFISAKTEEIIFTKNTTESINLVAKSLDMKGKTVITSDKEHNSNLVPWQMSDAEHRIASTLDDGSFDIDDFESKMNKKVRIVSVVHTSNIDGTTLPVREIAKIAHDHGALAMIDAAQSAPHAEINVKKLGVDFAAFSGHKMLGPSIGVLYGKKDALEQLSPFMTGGDTVESTTYNTHKFLKPPEKFEAGLQNYAGAIGLSAAIRYLEKIRMDRIGKHERELNRTITEQLEGTVSIIGPAHDKRSGIFPFNIGKTDPGEVAIMLDAQNIAVRSGQHCAHSWFADRRIKGSVRASLYLYNTEDECVQFTAAVKKIARMV